MRRAFAVAVCSGIMAVASVSVAHAQATRTWVSGVGDDVNPCSRTAPCKTFAGAISKTAAGGEINCLDPGGFGTITITKSITIDCRGTMGHILSALAPTAVNVNGSGTNIIVTLRNLDINAVGTGTDGIRLTSGGRLILENVTISGVTRYGVWVPAQTTAGGLVISNSSITNGVDGVRVAHSITTVVNTVIAGNGGFGLISENSGIINADAVTLSNNTTGAQAGNGGAGQGSARINISNSNIYGNSNGFGCGLGVIASDGSNRTGNNTNMPCTPNGTIVKL